MQGVLIVPYVYETLLYADVLIAPTDYEPTYNVALMFKVSDFGCIDFRWDQQRDINIFSSVIHEPNLHPS